MGWDNAFVLISSDRNGSDRLGSGFGGSIADVPATTYTIAISFPLNCAVLLFARLHRPNGCTLIFSQICALNVLAFNCLLQQCEMWSNVNCVLHFAYVNSLLIGTVADN